MHEVVIERPRGGPRIKSQRRRFHWRVDDDEDFPARKAIGPLEDKKWLTDLLGPLRRFLHSRVGRPWDDVYSEMRAVLAPDSLLQQHIFEHVHAMVMQRMERRDGVLVDPIPRYVSSIGLREHGFYVCSTSGRLLLEDGRSDHPRDHDGYVSPQRFLARRIGQPWEEVRAACNAAMVGAPSLRLSSFVVESAVLIRRGVRWRAYRVGAAGQLIARLRHGQLFVAEGVLRKVGEGPRGVGRGGAETGGRGRRMRSGDSRRWR
jgi:hypothetical protein